MKRNEIKKVGLSLIIAALFIFSAVNAIATTVNKEKGEAGDVTRITPPDTGMVRLPSDDPISQEDPYCGVYIQGLQGLPNGALIAPGTYDLILKLWYDPTCYHDYGPPVIKAFAELYEKCCPEYYLMYETSFEDNFDIYNNWIQEDADCGITKEGNVGFYDTWTWTDERANCGSEHSMKCTMYDIYKGNQDDYLECTKSFDISDQFSVKVEFDIWVEGQHDTIWAMGWVDPDGVVRGKRMYTVYDYLDFEVGDQFGNWVNPDNFFSGIAHPDDFFITAGSAEDFLVPGAYMFPDTSLSIYEPSPFQDYTPKAVDKGGGWWTITYEVPTWVLAWYGLDVTDIQFRFSWHSDPEFQYEGAYVDCFKVWSGEDCEEKIFQTHTQGPVVLDPQNPDIYYDPACGNYYVKFPMQWDAEFIEKCGQKESCYDFLLWIEVLNDPCTYWTPYDWPFPVDVMVCVGDWFSCEVDNLVVETSFEQKEIIRNVGDVILGDGIMIQGDDAHIMADVHACGAVPTENLAVTCIGEKVSWEVLYETSCDSSMGWEFGHFGAADSLWHITDTDSWDPGGKSLGCFNEDTNHYENDMYVDYALNQMTFDIEDLKACVVEYYTKFITASSGDFWAFMLFDPATNYVLGNIGGVGFSTYGYHPEWRGPMQPMGTYQAFDIFDAYEYWHDVRGMFRDANGDDSFEVGFGYAMWGTDGSGYVNAQAEADGIYWSGLYFDEIKVMGEVIGEKVFEQTVIIPGPMEPCDWTTVQFEWEDVPYSNYKITVVCEQGCNNCGDPDKYVQILVVSNKEKAHWKEVESIDYTGEGGEWGISSSDTDNYLASNADYEQYDPNMNAMAVLAPDHGGDCDFPCNDISHLAPIGPGTLLMDFDAWWDIEGYPWDWCELEIATECPADKYFDWHTVLIIADWTGQGLWESSEYWYAPGNDGWVLMSNLEAGGIYTGWDAWPVPGRLSIGCVMPDLGFAGIPVFNNMIDLGAIIQMIDPTATQFSLRFRFVSDSGLEFRGIKLDDIFISNLIYNDDVFPPTTTDFLDPCDDMSNWCTGVMKMGQYWEYDSINDRWCTDFPALPVEDGLIWTTEIKDCYEALLTIQTAYDFGANAMGELQIKEVGGTQWYVLDQFTGQSGGPGPFPDGPVSWWTTEHYNLNYWVGKDIQIRFLATGGDPASAGKWCVKDMTITGKQDHTAPTASITMSGTMKDSGWYSSAVKVKITAEDEGSGVKEIHYILDGVENVVAGDVAEFTISGNGIHTLEYWAVDNIGNEGAHHTVPSFKIDSGAAPTVAITAPEPGIYLFGKKLLDSSKVFIIGAFTIEATASDADSGIYKLSFFLDDQLLGEDTEAPFSQYVANRHMGAGTIKVIAEDFAQNVAEDTLDLNYYKFF
jgi:hypothetical protein